MGKTLEKSHKALKAEIRKQFKTIICFSVEMWQEQGLNDFEIENILRMFDQVWKDSDTSGVVMLQMCEDETGIELQLDGEGSFHDCGNLNFNTNGGRYFTEAQQIYVNNIRKKWVASMCLASMCIALHRVRNFEFEELSEYVLRVNEERKKNVPVGEYMRRMEEIGKMYLLQKRSSAV